MAKKENTCAKSAVPFLGEIRLKRNLCLPGPLVGSECRRSIPAAPVWVFATPILKAIEARRPLNVGLLYL